MYQHSLAFSFVDSTGFASENDTVFATTLGVTPAEYQVSSNDDVPALAAALAADTDVSSLKVVIINVEQSLGNEVLSTISQQVQEAVKAAGAVSSYAMAIAGKAGANLSEDSYVSLQQIDSVSFPVLSNMAVATPQVVGNYLYPNTLTGILVMLFIAIIMIIGFLLLMDVQTPIYFPKDKIDFGKIEK